MVCGPRPAWQAAAAREAPPRLPEGSAWAPTGVRGFAREITWAPEECVELRNHVEPVKSVGDLPREFAESVNFCRAWAPAREIPWAPVPWAPPVPPPGSVGPTLAGP